MPYILISNDDGYAAPGINFLARTLHEAGYDVLVMAPDGVRSGYSTAFTIARPISVRPISSEERLEVYACSGTPADCVKVALNRYARRRPDIIIGGINHGDNSSVNAHYSGTVGITSEGAMQGIPSVAFSLCDFREDADFTPLRPYLLDITAKVLAQGMPPFTCLNVNFPLAKEFRGVRLCRMSRSRWQKEIEDCPAPQRGHTKYYWMAGERVDLEPKTTDTDRWALEHDYVAVTPITLDNTDYRYLEVLSHSW